MNVPQQILNVITAPARWGFPIRVGISVGVILTIVTTSLWIIYGFDPRFVNLGNYMSWTRIAILIGLLIAVSLSTWLTIRIWSGGVFFPDRAIDREISAGVRAMRSRGITPASLPIHLLLGSPTAEESTRFVSRTNSVLRSDTKADSAATIQWLASSQAITLAPIDCGLLNLTLRRLDSITQTSSGKSSADTFDPLLTTLQQVGWEADASTATSGGHLLSFIQEHPGQALTNLFTDAEASVAQNRLQQVCERLVKVREPLCPINHLVIRLPASILLRHAGYAGEIARALRWDLEQARESLQLDATVSVVLDGWQEHPGFVELIRRLGPHAAESLLPGCHCNVESRSTKTQLASIADLACADIENHIYEIFQRPDALAHAGNSLLYQLLSDIRVILRPTLTEILVGGIAEREDDPDPHTALPVAGCFLMATGETPPALGFAAPFGRHAETLQERLVWHPRQRTTDRVCRFASRTMLAMSLVLAVTFLGIAGRAILQTASHASTDLPVEGNVHVSVD
ncbi:type VI secretion protein IcmF/TssM N-terminal domain-containing protein [Thalassoroseus pseudoceratinae]|uniref:type VI secretion protein IcmF/TssM N-terminal domain-containing protein n=1 Tax=Thalassoroseus pseudoceratinae TaxID=2713176 RepID=UPI0014243BF6|nr:type VI secretion protein IcmF/TssM N-terminal domain-containing protein [Thalassoroseus pseudoceratinae]